MGTMDASIVNISFPVLTKVLNTSVTTIVWVTLAYTLVSTGLLLFFGRIGDLIGRKKIYAAGSLCFTLGLALCALSASAVQLIAFRVIQAVGAAMTISSGTAIITEAFPPEERGRGLGFLGTAVSAGFISGPILGGLLLEFLSWRSIFFIRAPIGLVTFFMAIVLLRRDDRRRASLAFDFPGTFLSFGSLVCLMIGVNQIPRLGLGSTPVLILLSLGILGLATFVGVERRSPDPVIDISLFANTTFSGAASSLFFIFIAYQAFIFIMPFYLMEARGATGATAGTLMAVTSMTTIVVGPLSGWASDRYGSYWFCALGAAIAILVFILMRSFDLETALPVIVLILILNGLGIGVFHAPNNSIIMGSVGRQRLGTASALIATLRSMGISMGMALAGSIFSARKLYHAEQLRQRGLPDDHLEPQSICLAFHDALVMSILFGAMALFLALIKERAR